MSDKLKKIQWFRRMSEIGGIFLGAGLGLVLMKYVGVRMAGVITVISGLVGLGILLYENEEWKKYKKGD